jgi:hypothetical protein
VTGQPNDEGSAAIAVMGIGLLAVAAAMALATMFVAEYRATEDSLLEVRAYWASMGQAAYVLSRTAQSGACNGACPAPPAKGGNPPDYQKAAQAYLEEITSGPAGLQTWLYPDVSANYCFTLQQTVVTDPLAPASSVGEMLLVAEVGAPPAPSKKTAACSTTAPAGPAPPAASGPANCPPPAAPPAGTLPALRDVSAVRPVEVRYCLVVPGATACGAGPGATTSGTQLVTSVHRPSC